MRSVRCVLIALSLLMWGCRGGPPQTKDAVQVALLEHLRKNAGLDLSQMKVDVGAVAFRDKEATATVSFRPNSSPDAGMQLTYTLEQKDGKWAVKGRPSGMGGMAAPHGGEAPRGSPAPGGAAGGSELPPGHPPVNSDKGAGQPK